MLLQNLDAVTLGQSEVQQHQIVGPLGNTRQSLRAIAGDIYGVAFELQQGLERLANRSFVVNDQHRPG